ncbi:hypothetical protein BZL30_2107 [Mycobacterium kansasii]|uniref:Uncharacterized protein n=1 Tax=Mycobacterium kansasii TaxID=1768 RepID=A0A1V3XGJ7_MYCKA|nr:hypothetical protein BZL30_2107 [Mycobacterium kansasii]
MAATAGEGGQLLDSCAALLLGLVFSGATARPPHQVTSRVGHPGQNEEQIRKPVQVLRR